MNYPIKREIQPKVNVIKSCFHFMERVIYQDNVFSLGRVNFQITDTTQDSQSHKH